MYCAHKTRLTESLKSPDACYIHMSLIQWTAVKLSDLRNSLSGHVHPSFKIHCWHVQAAGTTAQSPPVCHWL